MILIKEWKCKKERMVDNLPTIFLSKAVGDPPLCTWPNIVIRDSKPAESNAFFTSWVVTVLPFVSRAPIYNRRGIIGI